MPSAALLDAAIDSEYVANATTTKDVAGNRKLDTGGIDGVQALAMAFRIAIRSEQATRVPDEILCVWHLVRARHPITG